MTPKRALHALQIFLIVSLIITPVWMSLADTARAETPAGYSEYYIPGSEEQMWGIFYDLDPYLLDINQGMHSIVAITAGADNTSLYYDHWEDGYDFVPGDPTSADESYIFNQGNVQIFESANIPVNPRGTDTYYDGRDRIYTAGGAVTVSRATWTESASTLFAQAWEVLPTRPYQTQYSIPAGENLAALPTGYTDFTSSYLIVQSTADNNAVQVDDPLTPLSPDIDTILNKGEVTQLYHINAGTTVNAAFPVQVQTIYGNDYGGTAHYDSRDFTLIPSALWDTEYYSPVGGFGGGYETDLYIYNPYGTDLTISYQDLLGQGSFTIPAGGTMAYSSGTGRYVPQDSGAYLSADQPFWGIGSADTESTTYDWGFSLLPASALTSNYYLGWAPGTSEAVPTSNGSPAFVTPVQDDTTVYVDFSPVDGSADAFYTLDRLEIQKIFDPDNDNTGMHIWSSAPLAVAWGEDANTADTAAPYLDTGFTTLPMLAEWLNPVLNLVKTADPEIIMNEAGQGSTFTLVASTFEYAVNAVDVVDELPPGWDYVSGSTTITLPDGSQISGPAAEPAVDGQLLTWDLNRDMSPYQTLSVVFSAELTGATSDLYCLNQAQATGSQGGEVFTAEDDALVRVSNLVVHKSSSAAGNPVSPGDTITYTIVITNSGSVVETGLAVSDTLPVGTSYVLDSSLVYAPDWQTAGAFRDEFNAISYAGSDGDLSWAGDWQEINENDGPASGDEQVLSNSGSNRLQVQDNDGNGEGALRQADLSSYSAATLSFEYRRNNLDNTLDYVTISASADGGASWTELGRFQGPDNDTNYVPVSYDLSPFIAADTQIRFLGSRQLGGTDRVFFDNIQIEVLGRVVGSNPGSEPPMLVSAADGYTLLPGEAMTILYQVTVDDPLPPGLEAIVNRVDVTSLAHPSRYVGNSVSDSVSDPTALELVSFSAHSAAGVWPKLWLGLGTLTALVLGASITRRRTSLE